ncbi:hypothetical protein B4U80_11385, partial [Leptotrombidium deliense]
MSHLIILMEHLTLSHSERILSMVTKSNKKYRFGNEVVNEVNTHNHERRDIEIAAKHFIAEIKQQAVTQMQTPQQILASTSTSLSSAVAGKLPNVQYLTRTIQRKRQKTANSLPKANSLMELRLSGEYTKTFKNEEFILHDSGPQDERIILFGTQRNLDLLASSPHWFADGTFKTTPPLFSQIYTIHGIKYNSVLPS